MVCDQCKKQATMRHDLLAAAVRRAASSAGLPSNSETSYRRLAVSAAEAEAAGLTPSDVVVMAPDGTLFLLDIVFTHQRVGCMLAEFHGHTSKAAALAAADKQRQFRLHGDAEQYTLVPFAVESHGRLCKEAVDFLHMAAEWGAGSGLQRGGKGAWLMSFYGEVSCALQGSNGLMYAKSAERLICAQGRHFMPGAAVPPLGAVRGKLFL
jgi:hypothetical protein